MTDGIIVARFQVPVMNKQVKDLIAGIISRHSRVFVVLGKPATPGSRNNPLSVEARTGMIAASFPDVVILALADHPSDQHWSAELDKLLRSNGAGADAIIYGDEHRFLSRYSGAFAKRPLTSSSHEPLNVEEQPGSAEFRSGRVHAFQTAYPKVYPTVDIALFRENRSELLLGKKSIDNKWRLPGGFVDPDDDSYETAALRELMEEAGEMVVSSLAFESSFRVDDWRYRYEADKIITSLFSADFISGNPAGSDDLAEVKWISLPEVAELMKHSETVFEHAPMLNYLLGKYL